MKIRDVMKRIRRSPRLNVQLAIQRVARAATISELDVPLRLSDLADSHVLAGQALPVVDSQPRAEDAHIAWVALPAGAGSGGHTTLYRMIRAAHEAGFRNTLLFYNRFDADLDEYAEITRRAWPWLMCEIAAVGETIDGFDACVASSWATAHVVARRAAPGIRRLYFIQDFEPYFFPRGEIYAFAEDSYRFGFRNIALGEMIERTLERELGVSSEVVPFGADTTTYSLEEPRRERRGVVFYARPGNERRGYRLAVLALERFHAEHPDQPIHAYGANHLDVPFPVINHGTVSPARLAELYNGSLAGLALSFTNVSLVPEELLACGAIPVVNDHPDARAVLNNPHVRWAGATPASLAEALSEVVSAPDPDERAQRAAASVAGRSWEPTERAVVAILADEIGAARRPS